MKRQRNIHRYYDTYVVERYATVSRGLRSPPETDIVVGQGATVVGSIRAGGSVYLAKNVVVRGSVHATIDAVVGAACRVEGDVEAGGNVVALEGATIGGRVRAGARVRIIGARVEGPIEAAGDVEVRGEAQALNVKADGRVRSLPPPEEPA